MEKIFNEEQLYNEFFDVIYRICFLYIGQESDTYDMVQDTFEKMLKYKPQFESMEKAKAWLIVTASNVCKTYLKKWWHKKRIAYEPEMINASGNQTDEDDLKEIICKLDSKYSILLFLYYYEGYKLREIADMLKENESTLKTRLVKARQLLKHELEESDYEN